MAEFERYLVSITTLDGVLRSSVSSFYVSKQDAENYVSAADAAARAITAVGVLITRYLAMTEMVLVNVNVGIEILQDPVVNPADTILRGNKLAFSTRSGGRGLTFTIPGRKAASYSQSVDSLSVSITTPTAMSDFVASINNVTLDPFGNDVTVVSASIVD